MVSRTTIVLVTVACVLSALNAVALFVNFSASAKAAVHGMKYQTLLNDRDFTRAVRTIAEQCSVNVDLAKLICRGS
jgi:hypothetical protein